MKGKKYSTLKYTRQAINMIYKKQSLMANIEVKDFNKVNCDQLRPFKNHEQ